jgi:CYTH domain-containing protein
LTLKSDGTQTRKEYEININKEEYESFYFNPKNPKIEKIRWEKEINNLTYEFDFYINRNLIVFEVEVQNENDLDKIIPFGKDITSDKGYKNRNLAK